MSEKRLGILGGLGPLATVYFCEMLIKMTDANTDQEHIDMIINSHASVPDRTAYILGKSSENPLPVLIEDAKQLEVLGVDFLAMPCNTAHYFYQELSRTVNTPFVDMVGETVQFIKSSGVKCVGILATDGTISGKHYQKECMKHGVNYSIPSEPSQKALMSIIYDNIKAGKPVDMESFNKVINEMKTKGCDAVILGCTELSIIKKDYHLDSYYVDSLEMLAISTIKACGKKVKK
ncbi:MAG: hypothetical protein K0R15_2453 [Clostridiales bacterium]|jgi:aspartate racemase|nr:hypothetical protein [Clostridiales bacterium]